MIEIDAFGIRYLPCEVPLQFSPKAKIAAAIAAMDRRFFIDIVRNCHLNPATPLAVQHVVQSCLCHRKRLPTWTIEPVLGQIPSLRFYSSTASSFLRRCRNQKVKYIGETIEELRRYIVENDRHHLLEEVDTLLSGALENVRGKLTEATRH